MTPRKSKGGFIYRPDNNKAPSAGSAPPSTMPSLSTSAPDALNLTQLTTAANEIDIIMRPVTPASATPEPPGPATTDPIEMSPDTPSTFLASSTISSVITSVSRTKRKHTGSDLGSAVSGGSAAKRSRPPSAAAKAQQEGSDAITKFNNIFAGFVDKFNEVQASPNPEYACAIKLLKEHRGLSVQERMDISTYLGSNPKDVTLYVNSDAEVRALWLQQTLSMLNARNESGC